MNYQLSINREGTTDLSHIKYERLYIDRLEVTGTGDLRHCILTFRKGKALPVEKDLLLMKPMHSELQTLFSREKDFILTGYDSCNLLVLTGKISDLDTLTLYLSTDWVDHKIY